MEVTSGLHTDTIIHTDYITNISYIWIGSMASKDSESKEDFCVWVSDECGRYESAMSGKQVFAVFNHCLKEKMSQAIVD